MERVLFFFPWVIGTVSSLLRKNGVDGSYPSTILGSLKLIAENKTLLIVLVVYFQSVFKMCLNVYICGELDQYLAICFN